MPAHPGTVVPVITDPETFTLRPDDSWTHMPRKNMGRFAHAGETVRAYCRDNGLSLTAVVCASRTPKRPKAITSPGGTIRIIPPSPPSYPDTLPIVPDFSPDPRLSRALSTIVQPRLPSSALALSDEQTLISLYRTNVMDPLSVIRELSDLLAVSRGRVVFVNGSVESGLQSSNGDEEPLEGLPGASRMVGAARAEAARLLRDELSDIGIDVCEVVVGKLHVVCRSTPELITPGPMAPRAGKSSFHIRQSSEDSIDSDASRKKLLADALTKCVWQ